MLLDSLSANRRVAVVRHRSPYYQYDDPSKLEGVVTPVLTARPLARTFLHKADYNQTVSSPALYEAAGFLYVVREPAAALAHLMGRGYGEHGAVRYYTYRLRRLCEMARRTPAGLVVTFEAVATRRADEAIKRFVGVKELPSTYRPAVPPVLSEAVTARPRAAYERYLTYLRQLPLSVVE
jgi:hypothetical protein